MDEKHDPQSLDAPRAAGAARIGDRAAGRHAAAASITAEEMAAFRKVRDVVAADFGNFCGING